MYVYLRSLSLQIQHAKCENIVILNLTVDHRHYDNEDNYDVSLNSKSAHYYTNKYSKPDLQQLCKDNDVIITNKVNKGDLVKLIAAKMNSVLEIVQPIMWHKDSQSGNTTVSFFKQMISKWCMKPIIGNNEYSREHGLENEAIVPSVLNRYI